ncbi:MAG: Gfo/Idh/MocA family oxidoreductase [Enterococcus sp.]|nr:Gfo/Idh/MocA family oxidoreductase [Enterococcus sp.]
MKLGILGTGKIVQEALPVLCELDFDEIYILGTYRSKERCLKLVSKYQLNKYFFDYKEMLGSDADIIYVALPNHLHYEFSEQALKAGKHVILEKPSVPSLLEFEQLEKLSRQNKVMLLEAVTSFYLPAFKKLKSKISNIGEIKLANFNFSQYSSRYEAFKRGEIAPAFDPSKFGGALMDINVYNINAMIGLFGVPESFEYSANIQNGIDTSGILSCSFPGFKMACIGAKDCNMTSGCSIQGEDGIIDIPMQISLFDKFKITYRKGGFENIAIDNPLHRMHYEFVEFLRIIREDDFIACDRAIQRSKQVAEILEIARSQITQ